MGQLRSRRNRSKRLSRISNRRTTTGERRLKSLLKVSGKDLLRINRSLTNNLRKLTRSTSLRLTLQEARARARALIKALKD